MYFPFIFFPSYFLPIFLSTKHFYFPSSFLRFLRPLKVVWQSTIWLFTTKTKLGIPFFHKYLTAASRKYFIFYIIRRNRSKITLARKKEEGDIESRSFCFSLRKPASPIVFTMIVTVRGGKRRRRKRNDRKKMQAAKTRAKIELRSKTDREEHWSKPHLPEGVGQGRTHDSCTDDNNVMLLGFPVRSPRLFAAPPPDRIWMLTPTVASSPPKDKEQSRGYQESRHVLRVHFPLLVFFLSPSLVYRLLCSLLWRIRWTEDDEE